MDGFAVPWHPGSVLFQIHGVSFEVYSGLVMKFSRSYLLNDSEIHILTWEEHRNNLHTFSSSTSLNQTTWFKEKEFKFQTILLSYNRVSSPISNAVLKILYFHVLQFQQELFIREKNVILLGTLFHCLYFQFFFFSFFSGKPELQKTEGKGTWPVCLSVVRLFAHWSNRIVTLQSWPNTLY